jgi:hypothetical protein
MREELTLTILLAVTELVAVVMLSRALVTVPVLLATIELSIFWGGQTFSDTGHIQRVLRVC